MRKVWVLYCEDEYDDGYEGIMAVFPELPTEQKLLAMLEIDHAEAIELLMTYSTSAYDKSYYFRSVNYHG